MDAGPLRLRRRDSLMIRRPRVSIPCSSWMPPFGLGNGRCLAKHQASCTSSAFMFQSLFSWIGPLQAMSLAHRSPCPPRERRFNPCSHGCRPCQPSGCRDCRFIHSGRQTSGCFNPCSHSGCRPRALNRAAGPVELIAVLTVLNNPCSHGCRASSALALLLSLDGSISAAVTGFNPCSHGSSRPSATHRRRQTYAT